MRNDNSKKRWDRQEATKPDGPHGWIQWKGTDVCMDVHCQCGFQGHIDASFAYHYRCVACNQLFDIAGWVRLVPVPKDEEDDGSHPETIKTDAFAGS